MQVLRRPDTAQGQIGFWESSCSARTKTADLAVASAVQNIRGERHYSAIHELIDLFADADAGVEGCSVDPRAFVNARDLLESLPHGYAVPEVAVDPDGEIAFDWIRPDRTMVSVSVGPTRDLSYAANLRDGTAHGAIRFGIGFPASLVELLRRLYHPA
jgi:hypothetical protein